MTTSSLVLFGLIAFLVIRSVRHSIEMNRAKNAIASLRRRIEYLEGAHRRKPRPPGVQPLPATREEPLLLTKPKERPMPRLDAAASEGSTVAIPAHTESE